MSYLLLIIDSDFLLFDLKIYFSFSVILRPFQDILDVARSKNFDVLMSLGAGDIENYVPQITEILSE